MGLPLSTVGDKLSMDEIRRYYEILELEPGASLEEIEQSFKELIRIWHPDRFRKDPNLYARAEEKTKDLNEARDRLTEFLSDPGVYEFRSHSSGSTASSNTAESEAQEGQATSSSHHSVIVVLDLGQLLNALQSLVQTTHSRIRQKATERNT